MQKILNMILGCLIVSFGIFILQSSEIITGGTAGLALSLSYTAAASFALMFLLINIPFYVLAFFKMGWKFTISTIFAVTLLSGMSEIVQLLPAAAMHPLAGAVIGGTIIGLGLSLLFMNGSSLGGANILSLFLQQKYGWDPGRTLFIFDFLVILTGLYSVGLIRGIYSVISVIFISLIISYFKSKIADKNNKEQTSYNENTAVS
ncbi:YitT family protein [Evansella clarkii]|uniref:YitT family protein n=1 Tax=Evansella clarkii TaxID=79879 RepID=UPI000B43FF47|nr:YitT family protein [Evansella clarkii]